MLLFVNIIYVSVNYFKYSTDTKVAPYTPIEQKLLKLSICFNSNSLLQGKVEKTFYQSTMPVIYNKTLSYIFANLPTVDKLVSRCAYRDFSFDLLWSANSTECFRRLNITRYKMSHHLCYKLDYDAGRSYSFYKVTHSMFGKRQLLEIHLNPPFDEGHLILPLFHFDAFPYDERNFGNSIIPSSTENELYYLVYSYYEITRLPSPYDTHCKSISQATCYRRCIEKEYNRHGFSRSSAISRDVPEQSELKIPAYNDEDEANQMEKIYFDAISKCHCSSGERCSQNLVITFNSSPFPASNLTFKIETSRDPVVKIVYTEKSTFCDYLTQCFSLSGVWIGFSILSTLIKQKKEPSETQRLHFITKKIRQISLVTLFVRKAQNNQKSKKMEPKVNEKLIKMRLVCSFTFRIIILSVLSWQIINLSENYLKFETNWKFNHVLDADYTRVTLTICFALDEFFDFFPNDFPNETNYAKVYKERDLAVNFTLSEILKRSKREKIIQKCRFVNANDPYGFMNLLDHNECHRHIDTLAYYMDMNVCYRLVPKSMMKSFKQSKSRYHGINPGLLYSIIPMDKFSKFLKTMFVIHFDYSYPIISKDFGVRSAKLDGKKNLQTLTFVKREIKYLPSPYDTACDDEHNSFCATYCYSLGLEKYKRNPHTGIITYPNKKTILTFTDLQNETMYKEWKELELKCEKKCKKPCVFTYSLTYISHAIERTEFKMEILITSPIEPLAQYEAVPRMLHYDYLYQIFCSLAFWIGFSFLNINLFELIAQLKSKKLIQFYNKKFKNKQLFSTKNDQQVYHLFNRKESVRTNIKKYFERNKSNSLIYIFCSVGCIIHLYDPLNSYFQYSTTLDTLMKLENRFDYSFTICLNTYELLANVKNKPLDTTYDHEYYAKKSHFLKNLTIEDMFSKSPDVENIIQHCSEWGLIEDVDKENDLSNPSDRVFFWHKSNEKCCKLFEVVKFIMPSQICYKIQPRRSKLWLRQQVNNLFENKKILFMVALDSSILTTKFSALVTVANKYPAFSAVWAPSAVKKADNHYHFVSYIKYHNVLLPPPYSNDGFTHMLHIKCIGICLNTHIEKKNFTFTRTYTTASQYNKYQYLTYIDRTDGSINQLIEKVESYCQKICLNTKLAEETPQVEFTLAIISQGRDINPLPGRNYTLFYLQSTDSPVIKIIFKVKIWFFDLMVSIGSIISIWFGLSIMKVNPFTKSIVLKTV